MINFWIVSTGTEVFVIVEPIFSFVKNHPPVHENKAVVEASEKHPNWYDGQQGRNQLSTLFYIFPSVIDFPLDMNPCRRGSR
jgi:hypothetical protein